MEAVEDGEEGVFPVAYIVNLHVNTRERRFGGTDVCMVGHTYQTANVQNSPHQNIAPPKYRPI